MTRLRRLASLAVATLTIFAARGASPDFTTNAVWQRIERVHPQASRHLWLKPGDRLAICGDSITEQRMYSRIIETYLTACRPDLKVDARQFGWSGEKLDGFLRRMTNDVLRFEPTIATLCYGMNDHLYRPYEPEIGARYESNLIAIARSFQSHGTRLVIGSPGCIGKMPSWVKEARGTVADLNLNLATLRNFGIKVARQQHGAFADIFQPMWLADFEARRRYPDYHVPGGDGVHPDWAGQAIMAYAFLRALGLDGDLGTITVDLGKQRATATTGHIIEHCEKGSVTVRSERYPFCAGPGDPAKDGNIRSGFQWVPFDAELNRLRLVVRGAKATRYRVTWGTESRVYPASALAAGVNLASDFVVTPFNETFTKVDEAVAAKQKFETRQIQQEFHGKVGQADMDATVQRTEAERAQFVASIHDAMVPVTHQLRVEPE
jgi:lysophospholipase L1-like esterase